MNLIRIFSLFFCHLHLPLIIIEAQANEKDHQDTPKATNQAGIPE
jgi:hypothetical protein